MDWDDIFGGSSEQPTNPREIFGLLDKEPRFEFLRDVQADILDGWYRDRTQRDTVVKLDTGGGKTTSGLLMLQSCINEDVHPAVYLTPDKYLTEQVLAEASALGIEATDDEDDPRIRAGSAIYVTNIFKLFNERSIFGVGRRGVRLPIGAIIVDDAHACLATVANQFRIRLRSDHPAYSEIGELFDTALRGQSVAAAMAIKANDPHDYLEVPFWDVHDKADELLSILRKHQEAKELMFTYPFLADHLRLCRVVIGGSELEIEPLFPIPSMIPSFEAAKRRIYMSATLADNSVFVTHFGARPETLANPVTPDVANAMGDRMILLPNEINRDTKRDKIKQLVVDLARDRNCVVIVPSKRAPIAWLTDFVGFVPFEENGPREAFLTTDYNAEMIEHVEGRPDVRDRAIFVGQPEDIADLSLGDGLPRTRDWVPRHYDFADYILGRHPSEMGLRENLRARFGYDDGRPVCIVAVGGSAVGAPMIARILEACPLARERLPDLRMIVVTGPRLDPARFDVPAGVEMRAFVPDLDAHLAACDLALVQGGLTTCMELTAAGTPFLYFPLRNHFEQNFHVAARLDRYGAGRRMTFAETDAESIATAMLEELRSPRTPAPVAAGGAAQAARMIAEIL